MYPPITRGPGVARILLDGALPGPLAGADVRSDGRVSVDKPRMYELIRGPDVDRRSFTLGTNSDGLAAFAFTFTFTSRVTSPQDG